MHYEWSDIDRNRFLESTHRSRYLRCDGLINLPFSEAPLYAIQFASAANYPLYATTPSTLVILETEHKFYLTTSLELETIVGRWSKKRQPAFQDPHLRLNTMPYLWSATSNANEADLKESLELREAGTLEELYHLVVKRCRPDDVTSTYSSGEFQWNVIPRATSSYSGIPLGTPVPLAEGSSQVQASGRRKRRRVTRPAECDEDL
jgi:hypothetical protein